MTNRLLLYVLLELIVCARVRRHEALGAALEAQRAEVYRGLPDQDARVLHMREILDHDEGMVADRVYELPMP